MNRLAVGVALFVLVGLGLAGLGFEMGRAHDSTSGWSNTETFGHLFSV
jgi:hypothetical protein